MPEKVLTRVSLALDPATYREMEGLNDETVKFVGSAIHAFTDAHATLGKLWEARDLADGNPERVIGAKPGDAEAIRVAHDRAEAALKIEPTA